MNNPFESVMDLARHFLTEFCELTWKHGQFYVQVIANDTKVKQKKTTIRLDTLQAIVLRWLDSKQFDEATPQKASEIVQCLQALCLNDYFYPHFGVKQGEK